MNPNSPNSSAQPSQSHTLPRPVEYYTEEELVRFFPPPSDDDEEEKPAYLNKSRKINVADWSSESEDEYLGGMTKEEHDKIWEQYIRELRESDGFTVNVYPGGPFACHIPQPNFKEDEEAYAAVKLMATLALKTFKDEFDHQYELVDVERFVFTPGRENYLTFTGKQLNAAPSGDDVDVIKTIQALLFLVNHPNYQVLSCRIKPTNSP